MDIYITFLCAVSVAVGFALCLIAENIVRKDDQAGKIKSVRKSEDRQEY